MENTKEAKAKSIKAFTLLKDLLSTIYNVSCNLTYYPYDNLDTMDKGIRKMMWQDFKYDDNPDADRFSSTDKIFVIASNLGFYNIMFYIPTGENPDMISIGPFRNEDATPAYFEQILKIGEVPYSKLIVTENIFRGLPKADYTILTAVSKRVISEFFPGFEKTEVEKIEFKPNNRAIHPDYNMIDDSFMETANQVKDCTINLFEAIKNGDVNSARNHMHDTLTIMNAGKDNTLPAAKSIAGSINVIALIALLYTSVNPSRTLMLYIQMMLTIEQTTDISRLSYIPYDISHKYSLLVKNYGHASYHKKIREIVDYIDLHISDDLTLSTLAERFNYSPASLSASFKKETDTNLTTYVKQTRIREAIRLFNSSSQSISDVSLSVGYDDFAYFSRVFKEITGMSPRDYIKLNQAE